MKKGKLESLDIDPLNKQTVSIPYLEEFDNSKEMILTISAGTKKEKNLVPAGHEVAWEQFVLNNPDIKISAWKNTFSSAGTSK